MSIQSRVSTATIETRVVLADSSVKRRTSNLTFEVLEVPIARLTMDQAISQVVSWTTTETQLTRIVNFANVHMLAESTRDAKLKLALQEADLNLPDGRPVSWIGRFMFGPGVTQIAGPDFMPLFCEASANLPVRHFFYGGGPGVAVAAAVELQRRHPNFQVAGTLCPPFRPLSGEEERELCCDINRCTPDVIWICLGCPKQELWAARNRDGLNAKVILAVGQAVDILGGARRRAPSWTHALGLEWLYRLTKEPARLWKRYLVTNTIFIWLITIDMLKGKFGTSGQ